MTHNKIVNAIKWTVQLQQPRYQPWLTMLLLQALLQPSVIRPHPMLWQWLIAQTDSIELQSSRVALAYLNMFVGKAASMLQQRISVNWTMSAPRWLWSLILPYPPDQNWRFSNRFNGYIVAIIFVIVEPLLIYLLKIFLPFLLPFLCRSLPSGLTALFNGS